MARAEWRSAAARLPCPDALRLEQRRCGQHAQSLGRVSLHRFGVGGECDRISAVSEGLIRLTLVLAIQSFLRPPSELCHQWSRSSAICAREDNDLQCAFPAGPVPVSKLPRFSPDSRGPHGELAERTDGGFSPLLSATSQDSIPACARGYSHHNSAKYATSKLWQGRAGDASKSDGDGGPARRGLRVADPADTTGRSHRRLERCRSQLAAVAEVIASAFGQRNVVGGAIEGRPFYCPPAACASSRHALGSVGGDAVLAGSSPRLLV